MAASSSTNGINSVLAQHGFNDLLDALVPSSVRLQSLLDSDLYTQQEKHDRIQSAFLQAAGAGQIDTLEWLLQARNVVVDQQARSVASTSTSSNTTNNMTQERHAQVYDAAKPFQLDAARSWLDIDAKDDNGTPAIVLAAVFGHSDVVGLLVDAGANINATDSRGWSALFWAFQKGDLPLSSFLINRKAKTTIRSHTGLAAADLIRKGSAGEVFRDALRDIEERESAASSSADGRSHTSTSSKVNVAAARTPARASNTATSGGGGKGSLSRKSGERRTPSVASLPLSPSFITSQYGSRADKHTSLPPTLLTTANTKTRSASTVAEQARKAFRELALESAKVLEIDVGLLALDEEPDENILEENILEQMADLDIENEGVEKPCDPEDITPDVARLESHFNWQECLHDQMLSFSMNDLPALLDLVTEVKPSRAKEVRNFPANTLFLAARYASRYGGEDLLGELMLGAIDQIEASVHASPENLANSSFWLSNCVLLLYYLRKDPHTEQTTLEYQDNLYDTIRQIFVFCIRDVERRLDKILDASMLDHEALPGYSDVRFESEWRFVKALTNRTKKDTFPSSSGSPSQRPSVLSLFGSPDRSVQADTSIATPPGGKVQDMSWSNRSRTPSMPAVLRAGMFSSPSITSLHQPAAAPIPVPEAPSPKEVTALLSATLFVMQQYDYAGHPAIIVQAFSQLLYWLASELFNRILTRKRYLCRSKAIQIRLNVSALEEWARTNHLPPRLVQQHFRPLNELLQWLQCLSSEESIDGLLTTMQNVQSLNPVQLRKAVKDYRHEVEESRMAEECTQYLQQLQKDWERRRLLQGLQNAEVQRGVPSSPPSSVSLESQHTGSSISLGSHETSHSADPRNTAEKHIDEIFGDPHHIKTQAFSPNSMPDNHGEMLDSRAMLPFSLPTANDALLIGDSQQFGLIRSSHQNDESVDQSFLSTLSLPDGPEQHASTLRFPEPHLPEDILEALAVRRKRYDGLIPSNSQILKAGTRRRRLNTSNASAISANDGQRDHWLNWRERMLREVDLNSHENDVYSQND